MSHVRIISHWRIATVTTSTSGPPPPAGFASDPLGVLRHLDDGVVHRFGQVCIDVTGRLAARPRHCPLRSGAGRVAHVRKNPAKHICGSVTFSPSRFFPPHSAAYGICSLYVAPGWRRAARCRSNCTLRRARIEPVVTATVLNATGVEQVSTSAPRPSDSGTAIRRNFNKTPPRRRRRLIFNLATAGLSTGSYVLRFTVGTSPHEYTVGFQVK